MWSASDFPPRPAGDPSSRQSVARHGDRRPPRERRARPRHDRLARLADHASPLASPPGRERAAGRTAAGRCQRGRSNRVGRWRSGERRIRACGSAGAQSGAARRVRRAAQERRRQRLGDAGRVELPSALRRAASTDVREAHIAHRHSRAGSAVGGAVGCRGSDRRVRGRARGASAGRRRCSADDHSGAAAPARRRGRIGAA